LLVWC